MKRSTVVEEWRAEARAEGEANGEARGEAKGRIASVIELLEARFETIPVDLTAKIKQGTDLLKLRDWLVLAGRANSLDDFRTQASL